MKKVVYEAPETLEEPKATDTTDTWEKPTKTTDQGLQMKPGNMNENKTQLKVMRPESLEFLGWTDAFTDVYSKAVNVSTLEKPPLIGILKCQTTKAKDASVKAPYTRAKAKLAPRVQFDEANIVKVRYF